MNKIIILCSVVLVLAYIAVEVRGDVCPYCTCPIENRPVCGQQEGTGRLRGFPSRCMMDCSNMCRKNKYNFYKTGRCGKPRKNAKMTTTTSTKISETTTESFTLKSIVPDP